MTESDESVRPVTYLYADVVGSTSLGQRLSPEEVKSLFGEFMTRLAAVIESYGGTVQAYMGDGVVSYFGVPVAHEDDPDRAARAALQILELARDYGADVENAWGVTDFDVRVSVHTGRAAVGIIGVSTLSEVALGDDANVAARLEKAARPGTICVSADTARSLQPRFELERVGEVELAGRTGSVEIWRLLGVSSTRPSEPVALVGREPEVARLQVAVGELTEEGRGQVFLITGESGIGKTRLLQELRAVAGPQVTWLEGQCLTYGGVAGPFVDAVLTWLELAGNEPPVAVRTRLQSRLAPLLGPATIDVLPSLAVLLGVQLDAAGWRTPVEELREAYSLWVRELARERPVVLALEDVHWADAETRALLEVLMSLLDSLPILMALTLRLEVESEGADVRLQALGRYPHRAQEFALRPLTADQSGELVDRLAATQIDAGLREQIVAQGDGNPLYLEELVRALDEGKPFRKHRTWTISVRRSAPLPPPLENLLLSRVDALDPATREVAQVAAVIGRRFSRSLLESVLPDSPIDDRLASLLRADLVREAGGPDGRGYGFKHGLVREAVLSTLSSTRRQQLYGRVAAAAEAAGGGEGSEQLEMLAHYYVQSQDLGRALEYLERAGDRAMSMGAVDRAAELWSRARETAVRSADSTAATRLTAKLVDAEDASATY